MNKYGLVVFSALLSSASFAALAEMAPPPLPPAPPPAPSLQLPASEYQPAGSPPQITPPDTRLPAPPAPPSMPRPQQVMPTPPAAPVAPAVAAPAAPSFRPAPPVAAPVAPAPQALPPAPPAAAPMAPAQAQPMAAPAPAQLAPLPDSAELPVIVTEKTSQSPQKGTRSMGKLISSQIKACWKLPKADRNVPSLSAIINIDQQGGLSLAGFTTEVSTKQEPLANSIKAALSDSSCNPLKNLPPQASYDEWKAVIITFNARR